MATDPQSEDGLIESWIKDGQGTSENRNRPGARARVTRMADVAPTRVRWLWDSRIPLGKLTGIVGDPGEGKSTLAAVLAAHVSTGRPLPGHQSSVDAGNVLLLSAEDGKADTIRPRLDAAHADVRRVFLLENIEVGTRLEPFRTNDPAHLRHLMEWMENYKPILVVIDPISAFLGSTDSHRDAEVRAILAQLAQLADDYDCAVVLIRHLTKGSASRALYRAIGSIGFTAAFRSELLVGHDPSNPERRAIVQIKNNLARESPPVGFQLTEGGFTWLGDTNLSAAKILSGDEGHEARSSRAEAEYFLRATLQGGALPSLKVLEGARQLGIAERTLKRAKEHLGVKAQREGFGANGTWSWRLPERAAVSKMANSSNLAPYDDDSGREQVWERVSPVEGQGPGALAPYGPPPAPKGANGHQLRPPLVEAKSHAGIAAVGQSKGARVTHEPPNGAGDSPLASVVGSETPALQLGPDSECAKCGGVGEHETLCEWCRYLADERAGLQLGT